MTLINRLIREAKSDPPPRYLVIPRHRVRQVAEHARMLMQHEPLSCDGIEKMIIAGEMKMMGIPVRVAGGRDADVRRSREN
jgi:hypothetical protein